MADDHPYKKKKLKWAVDNEWNVEWDNENTETDTYPDQIKFIASDGFFTFKLKEAKDHHKELVPGHKEPESEDEHVMSDDYDTYHRCRRRRTRPATQHGV